VEKNEELDKRKKLEDDVQKLTEDLEHERTKDHTPPSQESLDVDIIKRQLAEASTRIQKLENENHEKTVKYQDSLITLQGMTKLMEEDKIKFF